METNLNTSKNGSMVRIRVGKRIVWRVCVGLGFLYFYLILYITHTYTYICTTHPYIYIIWYFIMFININTSAKWKGEVFLRELGKRVVYAYVSYWDWVRTSIRLKNSMGHSLKETCALVGFLLEITQILSSHCENPRNIPS